jgi:hypothetical protein
VIAFHHSAASSSRPSVLGRRQRLGEQRVEQAVAVVVETFASSRSQSAINASRIFSIVVPTLRPDMTF